jgi:hypothetical protein
MVRRRWALGRVLLIWCAWPVLLVGGLLLVVSRGGGFSLDLLHPSIWVWMGAIALGPPLLATIAWGRHAG